MHASHRPALEQQKLIQHRAEDIDSYAFFKAMSALRVGLR